MSPAWTAQAASQSGTDASSTASVSPADEKLDKKRLKEQDKNAKKAKEQAKQKKDSKGKEKDVLLQKAPGSSGAASDNLPVKAGEKASGSASLNPASIDYTTAIPADSRGCAWQKVNLLPSHRASILAATFHGMDQALTVKKQPLASDSYDEKTSGSSHAAIFTKVLVENPKTGKTVVVKVNDRGPYVRSRVIICHGKALASWERF